jgi:hypothetical protein
MCNIKTTSVFIVLALLAANVWGADVILNEYNAVGPNEFLGGGDAVADAAGGRAFDSYFGRIQGNGGDWFELVVIKDHLDMRGWRLDIYENKLPDTTLTLTNHAIWQDLRAGTIITVAEDVPSDISYDPAAGDWWINVQANKSADGLYITAANFPVSSNNWQLRIRDKAGQAVFGPAGEGISPATGISGTEVFRLQTDPSDTVTADFPRYNDGSDFSTFGAPNRWGSQDFSKLRPVVEPATGSLKVLAPNGGEVLAMADIVNIRWESQGINETVRVEFSIDDGYSWTEVYPPNVGNTGMYKWLVPLVNAPKALVRVSSVNRPAIYDVSDKPFTIIGSPMAAAPTGGLADFLNIAVLAANWLY